MGKIDVEISIATAMGKRWRKMDLDEEDIQILAEADQKKICKKQPLKTTCHCFKYSLNAVPYFWMFLLEFLEYEMLTFAYTSLFRHNQTVHIK